MVLHRRFAIFALFCFFVGTSLADDDAGNDQADDPSADWILPGSTDDVVRVNPSAGVQDLNTRSTIALSELNTIQPGQILVVRNWPCKVIGGGLGSSLGDTGSGDALDTTAPQSDVAATNVNVNVNVKVDVTVFVIGTIRCQVTRRRNLIQRLSCSSSDQCPDSGSVCKRVPAPIGSSGFGSMLGDTDNNDVSLDYSVPVANAEDIGDVSDDPTDDHPFDPSASSAQNTSASDGDLLADPTSEDGTSDDLSDFIIPQESTQTFITVKTDVRVRVQASRQAVAPVVWPTLPIGETILVQNRPCVITEQGQFDPTSQTSDLLPDTQLSDAPAKIVNNTPQSDAVNVNVDTHVDVGTVLALGTTRCRVEPVLPRPRPMPRPASPQGWCVCDTIHRFACKNDIECQQRWGAKGAALRCLPTFACPVKGRTGYCRLPADFVVSDVAGKG